MQVVVNINTCITCRIDRLCIIFFMKRRKISSHTIQNLSNMNNQITGTSKTKHAATVATTTWHPSHLPFATNYNDHFETPFQAYLDIKPVLDWLCTSQLNVEKSKVRLYDPYYCNGRTATLLRELGYNNILHEKRDFYGDVSNDSVPVHDILITNPPFSDSHKTQCLSFCFRKLRQSNEVDEVQSKSVPFLLLMPAYVAAKQYFRDFLSKESDSSNDIVYLAPSMTYKYDHPENTGKEFCPFESLWYFGIGKERVASFQIYWESLSIKASRLSLATSLTKLQELRVISANNRPNPKQRSRIRKRLRNGLSTHEHKRSKTEGTDISGSTSTKSDKRRKRRF